MTGSLHPPTPPPWAPPSPLPDCLRTDRLLIRFHAPDDAPLLLDAIEQSRDTLLPWLPWARRSNRTLSECAETIERFRANRDRTDPVPDDFPMGIFDRETGALLGGTGLHRVRHGEQEAEIGYWVRGDRRRQGLATEAGRALIAWGVRPQAEGGWGFRRLVVRCASENIASVGVIERLGVCPEAHMRADTWLPGHGYVDTLWYGVLASEWPLDTDPPVNED